MMADPEHPQNRHPETSLSFSQDQDFHFPPMTEGVHTPKCVIDAIEDEIPPEAHPMIQGRPPHRTPYTPANSAEGVRYFRAAVANLDLSPRRQLITQCLANGLTVPETTQYIRIMDDPVSEHTIRGDIAEILGVLEVENRFRIVPRILKLATLPPDPSQLKRKKTYDPELELATRLSMAGMEEEERTVLNLGARGHAVQAIVDRTGYELSSVKTILRENRGTFRVRRGGLSPYILGISYALPQIPHPEKSDKGSIIS